MKPVPFSIWVQPFIFLPAPPKDAFNNTTALITGGNAGIGLETARHLLKSGCKRVIIGSRDLSKGESAKQSLLETPGLSPDADVEVWPLDLTSFSSTISFAERTNSLDRLDYVFLNAGLVTPLYSQTVDGWESTLQVNALSTALLALLLLPKLVENSTRLKLKPKDYPRLVITTSGLHAVTPFLQQSASNSLKLLNSKEGSNGNANTTKLYSITKLFNIYTVRGIAKLIPNDGAGCPRVFVSGVDPGLCRSGLQKELTDPSLHLMLKLCGRTAEYGSRNLVAAARLHPVPENQATYVADGAATSPGGFAVGPESSKLQAKVWTEIVDILRDVAPQIDQVLKGAY